MINDVYEMYLKLLQVINSLKLMINECQVQV